MENTIKENQWKRELTYQGEVILTYDIRYLEIIKSNYTLAREVFNKYNRVIALELKKKAETELFEEAKKLYEYNKENGYPIMVYEIMLVPTITYNQNNIVSLYQDQYNFTGGAHGNTIRSSQNWNLEIARQIPLYSWYPNQPYFLISMLKQINQQIAKNKENYFENSCELVIETFNPHSYFITPNGINIYFQQYDIAPYSTGISNFLV